MRLRDLRESNDKTQQEIADILHCSQSLYSKYERNEREVPLWVLINLSFLYDTSIDYIVGMTNESAPYRRDSCALKKMKSFEKKISKKRD
ncbi:helix-turn-helix domain-containing protein [Enterococcus casseliflavus]